MVSLALIRLLQLTSPILPVGAYTYSQGLEWAIEQGVVHNELTAQEWIEDSLRLNLGHCEAPLVGALMRAWQGKQHDAVGRLNHWFVVSRESAELRAETVQMGFSLRQLLEALPCASPFSLEELRQQLANFPEIAYPVVWSGIATVWQIPAHPALTAYLWSWLENQVMAALKAVPLGQSAGQRLLFQGGAVIESVVNKAMQLPEAQWINVTPALAIASACHETQYSRLFRS